MMTLRSSHPRFTTYAVLRRNWKVLRNGAVLAVAIFAVYNIGPRIEATASPVWTDQNWSLTWAGSDLILQGGYTVARPECRLVTFAWKLPTGVETKGWGKDIGQIYGRNVSGDKVNIGPVLFSATGLQGPPIISAEVTYSCGAPWVLHQGLGPVSVSG